MSGRGRGAAARGAVRVAGRARGFQAGRELGVRAGCALARCARLGLRALGSRRAGAELGRGRGATLEEAGRVPRGAGGVSGCACLLCGGLRENIMSIDYYKIA